MSGPFGTEAEAAESVRHIIDPGAYDSETQANRALLKAAVTLAGVDLGAYDRATLDRLADFEPATVAVIAGLVIRAAVSVQWQTTIGQALADAIAWRSEQGPPAGITAEMVGLYRSAARALGIPGDVSQGPGKWHPDAEEAGQ